MTAVLILLLIVFASAAGVITYLYINLRGKLTFYQNLRDAEDYQASCEARAQEAQRQYQTFNAQLNALNQQLTAQKGKVAQYQQLLGKFQSAAELNQRIEHDSARVQQLTTTLGILDHAVELDAYVQRQNAAINQKNNELDSLTSVIGTARTVSEIAAQAKYFENYLAQLKADVESVEEAKTLQEFGFYRPRYNFDSSDRYEDRLDQIRDRQKAMLSAKTACVCTTEWTVEGSKAEGKKMVNEQIKLMLRAFNGECDAAIAKVRYNNAVSLENRIQKSFDQINKLGETKRIDLSREYFNLKCEELYLSHEFQVKKEEEKEVQKQIREQMKEEEKVAREIEKACEAAEREEAQKTRALEQARAELMAKNGIQMAKNDAQTAKLEELVARLENELHETLDRKAKAIARAQLTKSGHVYVLSNIGTFGEGVYKIGMSRRLEPLERVEELGGASVPFPFDVHAMIYSENAPELENALHRHFANRRVNMINLRREFFRVTLDEIRAAVAQHFGQVTFLLDPEAEQYRQTMAMIKDLELKQKQPQLQIA